MAKKIMNLIKRIIKVKNTKKEYRRITIKGRNFIKATIKNGSHIQKATPDMFVSMDLNIIPYGEVTIEKIRERKNSLLWIKRYKKYKKFNPILQT